MNFEILIFMRIALFGDTMLCSRFANLQTLERKGTLSTTRRHVAESCDLYGHVSKNLLSHIFFVYFTRKWEYMSGVSFLILTTDK